MNQDSSGSNILLAPNEDHNRFFADIFTFFIELLSMIKFALKIPE